jgi:hypothetical protein
MFAFSNVTYDPTSRGVLAIGHILRDGRRVGMFAQRPFGPYMLDFEHWEDRHAFQNAAINARMTDQQLAEYLLRGYEQAAAAVIKD